MSNINNLLYGRPRERKAPNSVQKMTKEELAKTLLKKKECNRKALEIVEKMLNNYVEEDWLISNLLNIRQNHFQDVTEERSILKLCGYPLCSRKLENIPTHKYHISAKLNKVYDTTERKKFCSNICYKAAVHLEKQLLTSPLWFTENSEVPNFSLMPITSASVKSEGIIGEEILFFPDTLEANDAATERRKKADDFISINQIAEESLAKMQLEPNGERPKKEHDKESNVPCEDAVGSSFAGASKVPPTQGTADVRESVAETTTSPPISVTDLPEKDTVCSKDQLPLCAQNPTITDPCPNSFHKKEHQETKAPLNNPSLNLKRGVANRPANTQSVLPVKKTSHIEMCLSEWCTLETLILLLGESEVKQMFIEKGKPSAKLNDVLDHRLSDSRFQEQYEKITRRLQLIDIEDLQFDGQLRGTPADDLKPLPSYTDLQEVSRKLELKVNAFYEGKTSYVDSGAISEPEDGAEENPMPLVDNRAQKTLRRKIVLDQLNRVLPNILRVCGSTFQVSHELRTLVNTFSLSANNISFKPVEWNLVGLVALNMLAMKDPTLKSQLRSQQAQRFQTTLLRGFSEGDAYIEDLLNSQLLDVDSLWNKILQEA